MSSASHGSGTKLSTRTAQARFEVANPGVLLRIEMYVDVEFTSPSGVGPVMPEGADSLNWSLPVAFPPRR